MRQDKDTPAIKTLRQQALFSCRAGSAVPNEPFQAANPAIARARPQQPLRPNPSFMVKQTPYLAFEITGQIARIRQQFKIESMTTQMIFAFHIDRDEDCRTASQIGRHAVNGWPRLL